VDQTLGRIPYFMVSSILTFGFNIFYNTNIYWVDDDLNKKDRLEHDSLVYVSTATG
jgi:hypothetical protein